MTPDNDSDLRDSLRSACSDSQVQILLALDLTAQLEAWRRVAIYALRHSVDLAARIDALGRRNADQNNQIKQLLGFEDANTGE